MDQRKVDSVANKTCVEFYCEEERGEGIKTYRGCLSHSACAAEKALCADKEKQKEFGNTYCLFTCCVSDGDSPCNGDTPKNSAVFVYSKAKTVTMMAVAMFGIIRF